MHQGYLELPTNKKNYSLIGIILIAFGALLIASDSSTKESITLLGTISVFYLLSSVNTPIIKTRSYPPKLSKKHRDFIKRRYGSIRSLRKEKNEVIDTRINLNLGFIALLLYSFYLVTQTPFMEFLLLFSLATLIFIFFTEIENGIGIIIPIYPIFLILPASIYLIPNPSNLLFASSIIGISLSSIFAIRELDKKRIISINIGGRGSFEAIILVSLISLALFI